MKKLFIAGIILMILLAAVVFAAAQTTPAKADVSCTGDVLTNYSLTPSTIYSYPIDFNIVVTTQAASCVSGVTIVETGGHMSQNGSVWTGDIGVRGWLPPGQYSVTLQPANGGNPAVMHFTIETDTTPPTVSSVQPSGTITDASPTIRADYSDNGIGVHSASAYVYLDGSLMVGCTKTSTNISCPSNNLTAGAHIITGSVSDYSGNTAPINGSFTVSLHGPRNYLWTWYDNLGGDNWILMSNPAHAVASLNFQLSIAGSGKTLPNGGAVGPGQTIAPRYGTMGGPVVATSITGDKGIVSQRSLWPKGGNSLEEVLGTDESQLSSDFYWTWYDQQSPGMTDWVLVANPSSRAVYYEITIAGQAPGTQCDINEGNYPSNCSSGYIAGGTNITPSFPAKIGGPVEVQAWTDNSKTTPVNIMASQRVLSNGGTAFNEVPGIPAGQLSGRYYWTWYDQKSSGMADWVLVANPSATDNVYYQIRVAGKVMPQAKDNPGVIDPGKNVTPRFDRIIGGPVELTSCSQAFDQSGNCPGTSPNVIASQRSTTPKSFEEVPGYPAAGLAGDYNWTWYDGKNSANWVLVANPSATDDVYYQVSIAGQVMPPAKDNPGVIDPGKNVTPMFDGTMNGPVEVRSCSQAFSPNGSCPGTTPNLIASQRVLWNGYFNEVLGTTLR